MAKPPREHTIENITDELEAGGFQRLDQADGGGRRQVATPPTPPTTDRIEAARQGVSTETSRTITARFMDAINGKPGR